MKRKQKLLLIPVAVIGMVAIGFAVYIAVFFGKGIVWTSPKELLVQYMDYIPKQEYEQMYRMLNVESSGNISQEDFIE